MKKIFLITAILIFTSFELYSQSGNSCDEATKNLEDSLGKVTVKKKTSDAFISNQNENLKQLNNESNVTF